MGMTVYICLMGNFHSIQASFARRAEITTLRNLSFQKVEIWLFILNLLIEGLATNSHLGYCNCALHSILAFIKPTSIYLENAPPLGTELHEWPPQ